MILETEAIELSVVFIATIITVGFLIGCLLCLIPHSSWLKGKLRELLGSSNEEMDASTRSNQELVSADKSSSSSSSSKSKKSSTQSSLSSKQPKNSENLDNYFADPYSTVEAAPISSTPTEPLQRYLPNPGDKKPSKYSTAGLKIKKKQVV